jgi:hypothetical protein
MQGQKISHYEILDPIRDTDRFRELVGSLG